MLHISPGTQRGVKPQADKATLLNSAGVRTMCGDISDMTLFRWTRDLGFPGPDLVISRRKLWRRSTVEKWLRAQERAQRQTQAPPRPERGRKRKGKAAGERR